MKIKKRLKDKAGMLVLTAVLVVAALIASVVSGCTEQVKAAENEVSAETSADTDNSSHKETKTTDADKNGSKNDQVSDSDKSADKGSDKTDKTETVYAKADSSGKIYDVSVEAVLKMKEREKSQIIRHFLTLRTQKATKNLQRRAATWLYGKIMVRTFNIKVLLQMLCRWMSRLLII